MRGRRGWRALLWVFPDLDVLMAGMERDWHALVEARGAKPICTRQAGCASSHRGRVMDAGAGDPNALAEELLLIMDGAWSAARVFGPGSHGRRAAVAARALISSQLADRRV
jgi:hypothetical protein